MNVADKELIQTLTIIGDQLRIANLFSYRTLLVESLQALDDDESEQAQETAENYGAEILSLNERIAQQLNVR